MSTITRESLEQLSKAECIEIILELVESHKRLECRVAELERQLAKDSQNSGKPPSSDGYKKKARPKSNREKGQRKRGGQPAHAGSNLSAVEDPDEIKRHKVLQCQGCGEDLRNVEPTRVEKRQEFDVLPAKPIVTEHQVEVKICPRCGFETKAQCPEHIKRATQYGPRVLAISLYLYYQHFLPYERISEVFSEIFGISFSPSTLEKASMKLYEGLEDFETGVKAYLSSSEVLNCDETGLRCNKKLHWLHSASNESATLYAFHDKRGIEGTKSLGLFDSFNGIIVHDFWKPYYQLSGCEHSLCNAHLLRELKFIHEHEAEDWAKLMQECLLLAKEFKERSLDEAKTELSQTELDSISISYDKVVQIGLSYHANLPELKTAKQGKCKQRPGKNLLDRFVQHKEEILRFVSDFKVPFTNNRAEQDLRMNKIQQKISGGWRTYDGATRFCRIRGFFSTARKQGWNILEKIREAFTGSATFQAAK